MKVKLSKSGVTNNLFQKNENKNFTAVKKNIYMMCMCW